MNFHTTPLQGLYVLENTPFTDNRGSFARIFCQKEFEDKGLSFPVAQMNISITHQKGSVRGMHFQYPPHAECKIVRCLQGACFDVAIDIRQGSPTFLQYYGIILSPEKGNALYIPQGFAHGFQTLEDNTQLLYTHSNFYTPSAEGALHSQDPILRITWPLPFADLSERDAKHSFLTHDFMGVSL